MKIGLIQNEAAVGDLSRNLRLVVQGYRRCLDAGAELVVASAQALDGAFLQDLAERSSFRLQARAALHALASETQLPLLLASYAGTPGEAVGARPYLLCRGEVRELRPDHVERVGGMRIFMDVGEQPETGKTPACDVALHLPRARWWLEQDRQARLTQEARRTGACVVMLRGVGCTEGQLSPGGSLLVQPGGAGMRLPYFEASARIWDTEGSRTPLPAAPPAGELLLRALCYGLREMWLQSGSEGLGIPATAPHAALLLALARVAVGARHTVALAPRQHPLCALAGRSRAIPAEQAAAQRLSPICPATLNRLLQGEQASRDALAPLAEVYEGELPLLHAALSAKLPERLRALLPPCPPASPQESTLRLLAEENAAPAEILARHPEVDEALLRKQLRRFTAARYPLYAPPNALHIRRRIVHLPACHRLSE